MSRATGSNVCTVQARGGSYAVKLSVAIAAIAAVSLTGASAAQAATWQEPAAETPLDNAVTVSTQMGGETMAEMLGLNSTSMVTTKAGMQEDLTLDQARENAKLGIFGSDANVNPNPYFCNYFYNLSVDSSKQSANAIAATSKYTSGPAEYIYEWTTDGTTANLAKRPKLLLGTSGVRQPDASVKLVEGETTAKNWRSWGEVKFNIAEIRSHTTNPNLLGTRDSDGNIYTSSDYYQSGDESYDPMGIWYDGTSFSTLVSTTNTLAYAAQQMETAYNMDTRYSETPVAIANDYERYVKATKCYVLSKIADGVVKKRTVAVVYKVNSDGTFKLAVLDPNGSSYSLGSQRIAEAAEDTVTDLAATIDPTAKGGSLVNATAAQLMKADVIICENASATESMYASSANIASHLAAAGYTDSSAYPRMFDDAIPTGTCGMTFSSQTTETAQLIGLLQSFVYPEVLNANDMLCYFYQHFYHLKSSALDAALLKTCAGVTMPEGQSLDSGVYSEQSVKTILEEGVEYYYANRGDIDSERPNLKFSKELDYAEGSMNVADATIESVAVQTCTGKAVAPALAITYTVGDRTINTVGEGSTFIPGDTVVTLEKGTDYTVSFANNTKPGTATVTITGKGKFSGQTTVDFDIDLAKAKGVKTTVGKKQLKVSWNKVAGASKYTVSYRLKGASKWATKSAGSKTALTLSKLKSGKVYQVRVTASCGAKSSVSTVVASKKIK